MIKVGTMRLLFLEVFMQVFVRAVTFGSVRLGFLIDAVLVFLDTGSLPDLGFSKQASSAGRLVSPRT